MPSLPRNRVFRRRKRSKSEATFAQRFSRFAAGLCSYVACCFTCSSDVVVPLSPTNSQCGESEEDCLHLDDMETRSSSTEPSNTGRSDIPRSSVQEKQKPGSENMEGIKAKERKVKKDRGFKQQRTRASALKWNKETKRFSCYLPEDEISDIDGESDIEDLEEWERLNIVDDDSFDMKVVGVSYNKQRSLIQNSSALPSPTEPTGKTGFTAEERKDIDRILLGQGKGKKCKGWRRDKGQPSDDRMEKIEAKKMAKRAKKEEKLLRERLSKKDSSKRDCKEAWQDTEPKAEKSLAKKGDGRSGRAEKSEEEMTSIDAKKMPNSSNLQSSLGEDMLLPGAVNESKIEGMTREDRKSGESSSQGVKSRILLDEDEYETMKQNEDNRQLIEDAKKEQTASSVCASAGSSAQLRKISTKMEPQCIETNETAFERYQAPRRPWAWLRKKNRVGVLSEEVGRTCREAWNAEQEQTENETELSMPRSKPLYRPATPVSEEPKKFKSKFASSTKANLTPIQEEFCCSYHEYLAELHGRLIKHVPKELRKQAIEKELRRRREDRCESYKEVERDDSARHVDVDATPERNVKGGSWAQRVFFRRERQSKTKQNQRIIHVQPIKEQEEDCQSIYSESEDF